MNKHIETAKLHLKRNKTTYISATAGVLAGAAGMYYYRGATVAKASQQINGLVNYKPTQNMLQITVVARRGHPGNIVRVNETGQTFASVRQAAEALGLHRRDIFNQIHGERPDVKGFTFTNLGEAK